MTWPQFIARYLLVALLGTALIVVVTPQVQSSENLAPRLLALLEQVRAGDAQCALSNLVASADLPFAGRDGDLPPCAAAGTAEPRPPPAAGAAATNTPAAMPRWGVAASPDARCYTTAGRFLRRLPPGTIVEVEDLRRNREDLLAVCRVAGADGERILVRAADLALREGPLAAVPEDEKALRVRHAILSAEVAAARRQAADEVRTENPHGAAFAAARAEYRAYWRRVRELQAGRDAAQGADHVRYSDELQRMKGDDVRLRGAYDETKRRYDEWNAAHPAAPGAPAPIELELARLTEELRTYER